MLIDKCIARALRYFSPPIRYLVLLLLTLRRGRLKIEEIYVECSRLGVNCSNLEKYLVRMIEKEEIVFDGETYSLSNVLAPYADTLYDLISDLRELEEHVYRGDVNLAYVISHILTLPAILVTLTSNEGSVDKYSKLIYMFYSAVQLELFTLLSGHNNVFREAVKSIEQSLSGES